SKRDWSSDVCSSDLNCGPTPLPMDVAVFPLPPNWRDTLHAGLGQSSRLVARYRSEEHPRRAAVVAKNAASDSAPPVRPERIHDPQVGRTATRTANCFEDRMWHFASYASSLRGSPGARLHERESVLALVAPVVVL